MRINLRGSLNPVTASPADPYRRASDKLKVVNEYDILSIHLARPKYIIYLAYSTLIYYKQNTNRIDW